jgi:hypothetical protein
MPAVAGRRIGLPPNSEFRNSIRRFARKGMVSLNQLYTHKLVRIRHFPPNRLRYSGVAATH